MIKSPDEFQLDRFERGLVLGTYSATATLGKERFEFMLSLELVDQVVIEDNMSKGIEMLAVFRLKDSDELHAFQYCQTDWGQVFDEPFDPVYRVVQKIELVEKASYIELE